MRESILLTFQGEEPVKAGQRLFLAAEDLPGLSGRVVLAVGGLPRLRAGMELRDKTGKPALRVIGAALLPRGQREPAAKTYLAEVLAAGVPAGGADTFQLAKPGFSLAWITLSDKGYAGLRGDESGPLIAQVAATYLPVGHVQGFLLPDDQSALRALLTDLALTQGFDLIVTTGGTGIAPSDRTPEATLSVIERRLPGFERAMTAASLAKTPMGAISRAVCGTLGDSIIVNLPGSPRAVRENFAAIGPALEHALKKLQGDPDDCAAK